MFNYHETCSTTKHPGSTDQFPFENTLTLSSTRDKEKGTTWLQWEEQLYFNWWLVGLLCLSCGLDHPNVVAGETLNIFLLTGISNINFFLHKEKKWMWLFIAKKHIQNLYSYLKPNNRVPIEIEEDICPCPGAGQNRPFPLLPPNPTWRSCKSSSWGDAYNQKASCACWCCCWPWTYCHNPCRQTHGYCAANLCAGYEFEKTQNLSFLWALSPHTDPIQQQHEFPHKPTLHILKSMC